MSNCKQEDKHSKTCPRFNKAQKNENKRNWPLLLLPLIGLISLIWFLIRVIPKPSRATYPCQRVAAPLASAFVIWLMGLIGSAFAYHKAKELVRHSRFGLAIVCFVIAVVGGLITFTYMPTEYADAADGLPVNSPVGVPRGIHPGRVVWVHDPNATDWDGMSSSEYWFESQCTDPDVIEEMMEDTILGVAGERNLTDAWDAIFRYYNQNNTEKGDVGYVAGEKIAIKCNFVTCNITVGSVNETTFVKETKLNNHDTSPQMIMSLLRQLVYDAGVAPEDIIIGDPTCLTPHYVYDPVYAEFPGVVHIGQKAGAGRVACTFDMDTPFYWSTTDADGTTQDYVPTSFAEAEYLINFSSLKGHSAGVTISGKNHYGSLIRMPTGWLIGEDNVNDGTGTYNGYYNMHLSLPNANWSPGTGHYRALVDLMGHKELGGKTVLYLMDGLYSGYWAICEITKKWDSAPFNGDWPSSIFASQDGVAIDSVAYDFILEEWPQVATGGAGSMGSLQGGAEDYLHEAALADSPPSGTFYDPERDGTAMQSLGVHEHWNNPTDKQYTRNLGTGDGIELYQPRLQPAGYTVDDLADIFGDWLDCTYPGIAGCEDLIVTSPPASSTPIQLATTVDDLINQTAIVPDIAEITVDGDLSDWADSSAILTWGQWNNTGNSNTVTSRYAFNDAADMLYIGIVSTQANFPLEIGTPTTDGTSSSAYGPGDCVQLDISSWAAGTSTVSAYPSITPAAAASVDVAYTVDGGGVWTIEIATPVWANWKTGVGGTIALDPNMIMWGYADGDSLHQNMSNGGAVYSYGTRRDTFATAMTLVGEIETPTPTIPRGWAVVDAELDEWQGDDVEWIPLDAVYYGDPVDIADAKFALRWEEATSLIYVAVVVTDNDDFRTDDFGEVEGGLGWDDGDRIEILSVGDAEIGTDRVWEHDLLQEYVVGPKTTTGAWASWGTGETLQPDTGLVYAAKAVGNQYFYEAAVKQFDNYGGFTGDPTVVSELSVGHKVRFDIIVNSLHNTGFGMKAVDSNGGRYRDTALIVERELVEAGQCGDWGYLSGDLNKDCYINLLDFAMLSEHWLEEEQAPDELIAPGAELVEVYSGSNLFEGPCWDPVTQKLYFVSSGSPKRVMRLDSPGSATVWMENPGFVNGTFIATDGRMITAEVSAHKVMSYVIGASGPESPLQLAYDPTWWQPNDLCQAANGNIYFTDPVFGTGSSVYLLEPDGTVTKVISDMLGPNGIIVSNDGTVLYVADTTAAVCKSYPINPDGTVGTGAVFFTPPAVPDPRYLDGLTIDEYGNVYVTGDSLWIVSPVGELLETITPPVDVDVSNVTFGGADGKILYITCRDKVYSLQMQVSGN